MASRIESVDNAKKDAQRKSFVRITKVAGKQEVVYEEVKPAEFKNEDSKLKGNQTTRSRNISGGGAVVKQVVHPSESLSKGKLFCIIVCVALLVAVSSAAITAIILTMNFDSRLREMALDISLKHGGMEKAISALNDSLVDVQASIVELQNKSNHDIFKEDNISYVQLNNETINTLLAQSQHSTTTLLKHDEAMTSLNDSLVDIHAYVVELRNDSRYYKEDNSRSVQHNNEAINKLIAQSQHSNTTLVRQNAVLTSLNDSLVDLHTTVVDIRNESRHYKEDNSRTVQHYNEAIHTLLVQSTSLNDSIVNLHASVVELYKVYDMDCYDIHQQTGKPTGLYYVKPHGLNEIVRVMCDMDTDGGGWTVMQYRYDGSVEFYRNFSSYENGFGSVTGELWLGLRYIQAIASSAPTTLRIDLEAADGAMAFQKFEDFFLSEGPDYKLNVGTSSGTAGDRFSRDLSRHKGHSFTTYDRDRDGHGVYNCAVKRHGGWWYGSCGYTNLNGHYTTPGTTSNIGGYNSSMFYTSFKNVYSLKSSKIMFRRN